MSETAGLAARINDLFAAIDARDTPSFMQFLGEDATFQFGSAEPAQGHAAIAAAVDGFFASIAGVSHNIDKTLSDASTIVCEGKVTYVRHDGSNVTLPFANVFDVADDLIDKYKIYIDIAPLYAE